MYHFFGRVFKIIDVFLYRILNFLLDMKFVFYFEFVKSDFMEFSDRIKKVLWSIGRKIVVIEFF